MTAARRRGIVLAVLALFLIGGVCAAWPWLAAARLLADLTWTAAPVAAHRTVGYTVEGRQRRGDFYPTEGPAGIVLVPGAAPAGKDDPALIRFAGTLVRAGFTVLIPDIEDERRLAVSAGDAEDVADAVSWLLSQKVRVGIAAISYGVGPALLAASRPAGQVSFVLGIGGYYDSEAVIGFFTTGWYREGGVWGRRDPNVYGRWVFALANAARLSDSGDRALIEIMARRRMSAPDAPLDDLARKLTPTARPVYELLVNTEAARIPGLIETLPDGIRNEIRALDLSKRDLSGLKARVLLVHGRADSIIPAGESEKLAAHLPNAQLFIAEDLAHTSWSPRHLDGILVLLRAARALLEAGEGR